MRGKGRPRYVVPLVAVALLLVILALPHAGALEVSTKAIKVVASHHYQDSNVQSYAGEMEDFTGKLDGRGGAIAVLDTGVDDEHPTFKNAFVAGARYDSTCGCMIDTTSSGERMNPDDRDGHGTHVASTALGRGGSDIGPRGVAPGAKLVDVKVSGDVGGLSTGGIEAGIDWVIDYNDGETSFPPNAREKVRIIVISFANLQPHEEREYDDAMAAVSRATDNGILVVAAAGNCGPENQNLSQSCPSGGSENDTIASPGAAPEALTVGAVDDNSSIRRTDDAVANYSSRGPNPGEDASDKRWRKPDLVAPGSNITAACHSGTGLGDPESMDCTMSGTSMATPHVAGAAAVVWQAIDRLNEEEADAQMVRKLLTSKAQDLGEEGWDAVSGYGYVDAYKAVVEGTNDPPISEFTYRPSAPEAGQQVTFDAQSSRDPNERDRIETFIWTIDGQTEKRPGDDPFLRRVFDEVGDHTIELVTVDSRGTEDPEPYVATVSVMEPSPEEDEQDNEDGPVALEVEMAYGPTPVQTDRQTWFDLSNSTAGEGTDIVAFAWDFDSAGDFDPDRESQTPRTNWTFTTPGERTIQVQVTDSQGNWARENVTIEVEQAEPEPPRVAIANPQEGDVIDTHVNVTWSLEQGRADTYALYVQDSEEMDPVKYDTTEQRSLEIDLEEGEMTIIVTAEGPAGDDFDQVNVTVVEDESLDPAATDEEPSDDGQTSTEGPDNPPRPAAADDADADGGDSVPTTAVNGSEEDEEANASGARKTPAAGVAGLIALLVGLALARAPREPRA